MPLYEFKCKKCSKVFLKFFHIYDDINNETRCTGNNCNGLASRKYSVPNISIFKPYYNVMAGEYFTSKKDAKEKCKRKYLELED